MSEGKAGREGKWAEAMAEPVFAKVPVANERASEMGLERGGCLSGPWSNKTVSEAWEIVHWPPPWNETAIGFARGHLAAALNQIETLAVQLKGADERNDSLFRAKNHWLDKARDLEAVLAAARAEQAELHEARQTMDMVEKAGGDYPRSGFSLASRIRVMGGTMAKIKYTVAVDFDGVLHSYMSPWVSPEVIPDPPVAGAIDWLKAIEKDFTVVIFTTRGSTEAGKSAVREWLMVNGWPSGINVRVTDTKPAALIYLDDRGYRFMGPQAWPSAEDIHRLRPWNK